MKFKDQESFRCGLVYAIEQIKNNADYIFEYAGVSNTKFTEYLIDAVIYQMESIVREKYDDDTFEAENIIPLLTFEVKE